MSNCSLRYSLSQSVDERLRVNLGVSLDVSKKLCSLAPWLLTQPVLRQVFASPYQLLLPASETTSALHLRWPDCVQVSRPLLLLACYAVCKKGLSVYPGQSLPSVWTFTFASISTSVTTNTSTFTSVSVLASVSFSTYVIV